MGVWQSNFHSQWQLFFEPAGMSFDY